jgi:formylglycine-generating enzyme required for sulfatase activity
MGDASLANAPPHPVRFTRGFFIADRETPVRILRLFLSEPESKIILQQFPVLGQTLSLDDEAPAAFVPWEGAVLFCNWLSRRESKQPCYRKEAAGDVNPRDAPANAGGAWVCDFSADGYRLPTEAEWEYACRAGTTTSYSFGIGDRWIDQYVVSVDHSGLQPSASAVRPPNNWGLFDMHGNLSEWCWDWFDPQPGRTEQVDPRGPPSGSQRVSRGGTFIFPSSECRSASRMGLQPQMPSPTAGFRMACTSAN